MIIPLCLLLCGCDKEVPKSTHDDRAATVKDGKFGVHNIYQTTIDGCQYLTLYRGGIIHKQNCTNHVVKSP